MSKHCNCEVMRVLNSTQCLKSGNTSTPAELTININCNIVHSHLSAIMEKFKLSFFTVVTNMWMNGKMSVIMATCL